MITLEYRDKRTGDLVQTRDINYECEYLKAIDFILYLYHINDDGAVDIYHLAKLRYRDWNLEELIPSINNSGLFYDSGMITKIIIDVEYHAGERTSEVYLPELANIEMESDYGDLDDDVIF